MKQIKQPILTCCVSQLFTLRFSAFLDASSHLYKRVRPSVCPSVRMSVNPTSKIQLIHLQSLTNHPWSFLDASSHLLSSAILVIAWILPPSLPPPEFNFFQINPFAFHLKNLGRLGYCSLCVFTYSIHKKIFHPSLVDLSSVIFQTFCS